MISLGRSSATSFNAFLFNCLLQTQHFDVAGLPLLKPLRINDPPVEVIKQVRQSPQQYSFSYKIP